MSCLRIFQIQSQRILLRVDEPDLFPLAADLYSTCCVGQKTCDPCTPADVAWECSKSGKYRISLAGRPWIEGSDPGDLFLKTDYLLDQLFSRKLSHLLQLQAAGVASPDGAGWLICGPSRAGKTSLTLALLLDKWNWLSDEVVLFGNARRMQMLGFPKHFKIREHAFHFFPETADLPHTREMFSSFHGMLVRVFDPGDVAPGAYRSEVPLAGIVFPRFDSNETTVRFIRKHTIEVAKGLLSALCCWQPWGFHFLTRVCQEIPGFELRYNNPRAIGAFLDGRTLPMLISDSV